jgi:hypothetical protein
MDQAGGYNRRAIMQVINESTFGGNIGNAVGTGLSGLINNLVQSKAQEMKQRNDARGYEQGWKLNPEQAQFVASQSPEFQENFVKALQAGQQANAFNKEINGGGGSPMANMSTMLQPQPQPSLGANMGAMGGGGNQQGPENAILQNLSKLLPQLQRQAQEQQGMPNMGSLGGMGPSQPQPQGQMQGAQGNQGQSVADIMGNQPLNPNLQAKAEDIKLKRESNATKERASSYKVVQKKIEAAQDLAAHADKEIKDLENVKRLNDSGQLKTGRKRQSLERFGLENWFTNVPTEVAAKILAELKTGVAGAFGPGTRPTNFLVSEYDKQLPRLINTQEGLDALLKNRILSKKAEKIVGHNINKLQNEIEKTKSPYPFNIIEQAREMSQPQLNSLAEQSAKNMDEAISRLNKKGGFKKSAKGREFDTLPPAKDYEGKTATNPSTGQKLISKGGKWVKA